MYLTIEDKFLGDKLFIQGLIHYKVIYKKCHICQLPEMTGLK